MAKYSPLTKEQRLAQFVEIANKNYDPTSLYPDPSRKSTFQVPGFNYDEFSSLEDPNPLRGLSTLVEERAQNQSNWDKWGNALINMGVTAGTTFLDGTIGTLVGAMNMTETGEGSAFWNNPASKVFQNWQEVAQEAFPSYYSQEQQEMPWYQSVVPFSGNATNFWADMVLKNMGFMIGTVASSALYGGAVRSLAGAKNIAKSVGEGLVKKLGTGSSKDLLKGVLKGEITAEQIGAELAKDAKTLKHIDGASQIIGAVAGSVGEARIEALQSVDEYKKNRLAQNPNMTEEELAQLDNDAINIGNATFLTNMAVLSVGNYAQFKNAIGGGYKLNKLGYDEFIKGNLKEGFKNILPESKAGKALYKAGYIAKELKNPLWEGMEEQLQKVGKEASTSFYGIGKNEKNEEKFNSYLEAFGSKLVDQFGSIDNWQDFAVGFISGGIGSPNVLNMKQSAWAGGMWNINSEYNQKLKKANEAIEAGNKLKGRIENIYDSNLRTIALESEKAEALRLGDRFTWENAHSAQIVNDAMLAIELGQYEEFRQAISERANISAEEVKAMFDKQSDEKTQNIYNNKTSEEIQKELTKRTNHILQVAEFTRNNREDLKVKFPKASDALLNELTYYMASKKDLTERSDAIAKKISELTQLLDGREAQDITKAKIEYEELLKTINTSKSNINKAKKTLNEIINNDLTNSVELKSKIDELKGSQDKVLEEQIALEEELNTLLNSKTPIGSKKEVKRATEKINNSIAAVTSRLEELKYQEENLTKEGVEQSILGARKKENDRLTKAYIENLDLLEKAKEELNNYTKEEENNRKLIKESASQKGLTYDEFADKINGLLEKNKEFTKKVKELYDYKPNLASEVQPFLDDLYSIEGRKRDFINKLAAAYSTNGLEDLQKEIDTYHKQQIELKNKKKFDAAFTNGKIVKDSTDGKEYLIKELDGKRFLYQKDKLNQYTERVRELKYEEGALEKYSLVQPKQEVPVKQEILQAPLERAVVHYDKLPDEMGEMGYDPIPKRTPETVLEGTTGNIGTVQIEDGTNYIKISGSQDVDDVINFQNFIDEHPLSEGYKGKPVSGQEIYGDKWEAQKQRFISLGYKDPDSFVFLLIVDKDGNPVNYNNSKIFTTLPTASAFTPMLDENGSLLKSEFLTKEDFKDEFTLILTRDKNGFFTSADYKKNTGKHINLTKDYNNVFATEVQVIKAKFAINQSGWIDKINKSEERHKKLLNNLPEFIEFSHKTRGIPIIQKEEYLIEEYMKEHNLTPEEVKIRVSTDGTIEAFGTSYSARKGFTYIIDETNERIIQAKPRILTAEESNVIIELLKTYCNQSKVEKDRINTTGAHNISLESGNTHSMLDILNTMIGFNKGTNNLSDPKTENEFISLNKSLWELTKKLNDPNLAVNKKNTLTKEYNTKIAKLQAILEKTSTHKRSTYFQTVMYDREPVDGGFIVIGFSGGQPNAFPLFKQVDGRATNEINPEVVTKLQEFLQDKYFNVKNRTLQTNEEVVLPTKIVDGVITELSAFKGKDGYKKMLLGKDPDFGVKPKQILSTRDVISNKDVKGKYKDGTNYDGMLPTAANRYLVIKQNQVKEEPKPENTIKAMSNLSGSVKDKLKTAIKGIANKQKTTEDKTDMKTKKADIEKRRNNSLLIGATYNEGSHPDELFEGAYFEEDGKIKDDGSIENGLWLYATTKEKLIEKINSFYDAELAELEQSKQVPQNGMLISTPESTSKDDLLFGESTKEIPFAAGILALANEDSGNKQELTTTKEEIDYMNNPEKLFEDNKEYFGDTKKETFLEMFSELTDSEKQDAITEIIQKC